MPPTFRAIQYKKEQEKIRTDALFRAYPKNFIPIYYRKQSKFCHQVEDMRSTVGAPTYVLISSESLRQFVRQIGTKVYRYGVSSPYWVASKNS